MKMTAGELIFFDTNILLSATDSSRESHKNAAALLKNILKAGYNPVVSGQVIREYLIVATRPADANGFGMSPGDAVHNIKQFEKKMIVYDEKRAASEILQHLIIKHSICGKRIHAANIAAVMKTHGIRYIVTDNWEDFSSFEEINILTSSEAVEILLLQ